MGWMRSSGPIAQDRKSTRLNSNHFPTHHPPDCLDATTGGATTAHLNYLGRAVLPPIGWRRSLAEKTSMYKTASLVASPAHHPNSAINTIQFVDELQRAKPVAWFCAHLNGLDEKFWPNSP